MPLIHFLLSELDISWYSLEIIIVKTTEMCIEVFLYSISNIIKLFLIFLSLQLQTPKLCRLVPGLIGTNCNAGE